MFYMYRHNPDGRNIATRPQMKEATIFQQDSKGFVSQGQPACVVCRCVIVLVPV